ncbi:DegV family protein [Chloroflexota bacterium]
MSVKIVTDSLADIDGDLIKELGISVVPVYVRFGEEIYKDRIEITTQEFYRRLVSSETLPTTVQPSPADFLAVYEKLDKETDQILVINHSSKLSGTYESALQAKNMFSGKACIEVIDSRVIVMGLGLGLVIIKAVAAAKGGADLDTLVNMVKEDCTRAHTLMAFDTLNYLAKGGRIGKAKSLLGSMLKVKPILTIKEGEVHPVTRVRSLAAGIEYMYNFVAGINKIEGLAVEYATTPEEAEKLRDRLGAIFPEDKIQIATVSPVIGTYVGPYVLSVSVLEGK